MSVWYYLCLVDWAPRGQKAMGRKVGDDSVISLCTRCHRHFHDTGVLPGLTRSLTEADFKRELKRLRHAWEAWKSWEG